MSIKFVYFGYDFMLHGVQRLIREGHELVGIFTFECDNIFNFNMQTMALAAANKIPVTTKKPTQHDIEKLITEGAECFFAAGYPYKIPPIEETKAYGINLHPSLLPLGRGLMPTPTIIMHQQNAAGLTAHKITEEFDAGDILDQIPFTLSATETVETYSSRIALAAPDMLSRIFQDIKEYWTLAKPQDNTKASTFPVPDDKMRLIDWNAPLAAIDKVARAFGRFGCLARIQDDLWVVYNHDIWQQDHKYKPGTCVLTQPRQTVIATKGGFFCIKDGQKLNAN